MKSLLSLMLFIGLALALLPLPRLAVLAAAMVIIVAAMTGIYLQQKLEAQQIDENGK